MPPSGWKTRIGPQERCKPSTIQNAVKNTGFPRPMIQPIDFTSHDVRIVILDIDRNKEIGLPGRELAEQIFEGISGQRQVAFCYVTKGDGFRVGFDYGARIKDYAEYRQASKHACQTIQGFFPNGLSTQLANPDHRFSIDTGASDYGDSYWFYPPKNSEVYVNSEHAEL